MNKSLLTIALAALVMSTAACGSKEKKQDISEVPAVESTQQAETSFQEPAPVQDSSLGASSSGRGH